MRLDDKTKMILIIIPAFFLSLVFMLAIHKSTQNETTPLGFDAIFLVSMLLLSLKVLVHKKRIYGWYSTDRI
jgi:hypothetical protein